MARGASSQNSSPPDHHIKKRKRDSDADSHPRKRSITAELEGKTAENAFSGDQPLLSGDAAKILEILENLDNQGLLDRTFPLQGNEQNDKSLRTLLEEADQTPLWVLRNAVNNLLPISTHPRSRPSAPAAQQARFVQTALSLLDQSSRYNVPIDSFPDITSAHVDSSTASSSKAVYGRKYALFQKLPTGEYWSSLDGIADTNIKDLPTGHAELVAILPDPPFSSKHIPKLGSYAVKTYPKFVPQRSREPSHGYFIDYGVNSSFAPIYDLDIGTEVHQDELAEFLFFQEQNRRAKARMLKEKLLRELEPSVFISPADGGSADVEMKDERLLNGDASHPLPDPAVRWKDDLGEDEMTTLRIGLERLEVEKQVQTLLEQNTRAIQRLEELQAIRISEGGIPIEGSEEWDLAKAIMSTLTSLTSLRPRASSTLMDAKSPLTPSPEVLHTLHQTLPLSTLDAQGWYGNLPPTRAYALRDDSTIKVTGKAAAAAVISAYGRGSTQPTTPQHPQANSAYYSGSQYSQPQTPQNYGYSAPSTPQPSYSASNPSYYNGATYGSPMPNGYHHSASPVIANTVRPGGYGALSTAPPLPSNLRQSFR